MRNALALVTAIGLLCPTYVCACLWDFDTLAMERVRFPEAHELIAGHFARHSDAYYRWRIEDRTATPEAERTAADYDDIAVAYDKLGEQDKAIETILAKQTRWPDEHQYETEANLGTFLIHSGKLEEGLEHIRKAIEINPDAHFGREIYQQLLVEYMIERKAEDSTLPLDKHDALGQFGFAKFVLDKRQIPDELRRDEISKAVKGVLGIMRFGKHDSPIVLEALADLLLADYESDSKMLASRAFLKASYEVDDPAIAEAYRQKAEQALQMQKDRTVAEIEPDFKQEIEQGDAFFEQIVADEQAWVEAGKNLDREFGAKYYDAPDLAVNNLHKAPENNDTKVVFAIGSAVGVVVAALAAVAIGLIYIVWKRRSRTDTAV